MSLPHGPAAIPPELLLDLAFVAGGAGILVGCTLLAQRLRSLRGRDGDLPPVRQIVATLAAGALVCLIAVAGQPR